MYASGNSTSLAPFPAASAATSSMRPIVASRSKTTGSTCAQATVTGSFMPSLGLLLQQTVPAAVEQQRGLVRRHVERLHLADEDDVVAGLVTRDEGAVQVPRDAVDDRAAGHVHPVRDVTEGVRPAGAVLGGEEAGDRLLVGSEEVDREVAVALDRVAALGARDDADQH